MDETFGKTLVISPHADDEVFGAFSFLDKNSIISIIATDESELFVDRPTEDKRLEESIKIVDFIKPKDYRSGSGKVNELYKIKHDVIFGIESEINKYKPDTVLIPFPSYNQDHKTVYEACIIALRPHDKNHFVKKVLMYDVYDYTKWGEKQMDMNYFREVDIKKKLKAYSLYRSQVRSYRSPKDLKRWAEEIGRRCNLKYAEGYKILRWVDG